MAPGGYSQSSSANSLVLKFRARNIVKLKLMTQAVAEWLRAWDTLTMFEAMVYGRS